MNVNENRLNKLIYAATINCDFCPLDDGANLCEKLRGKDCSKSCEEAVYAWLQEFDVAEALEAGAHIVNDIVIFPPEEIPFEPFYGTPCEAATPKGKHGPYCNGKDCDYVDCCPYDW